MDIDSNNINSTNRDRFVLSKGHASPLLYSVLAEKGLLDKELLPTFRHLGSPLQGHPNMRMVPGVDMSTGSLGQGLSAAVGMAIANKLDKKEHRVYALLGDGECQEGQIWEAAMAAAHHHLDNLCAMLDFNGLQIDGNVTDVMNPTPFDKKFEAFGWNVITVADGAIAITDSDCPGEDCVHSGAIRTSGRSIVCLPARLTIQLTGGSDDGLDAVIG